MRWRTNNRFAATMVLRVPGGFFKCGDPWHSMTNEVEFVHNPGWKVAVPSNAEDAVGLLPCRPGLVRLPGRVVRVAEVGQRDRLLVPVAELAEQLRRAPVAVGGLGVPAQVLVGVAETVPGQRGPVAVAELLVQRERLPAVREGQLVLAQVGVVPPDRVQRGGLAGPVTGAAVQVQGALVVGERLVAYACAQGSVRRPAAASAMIVFAPEAPVTTSTQNSSPPSR